MNIYVRDVKSLIIELFYLQVLYQFEKNPFESLLKRNTFCNFKNSIIIFVRNTAQSRNKRNIFTLSLYVNRSDLEKNWMNEKYLSDDEAQNSLSFFFLESMMLTWRHLKFNAVAIRFDIWLCWPNDCWSIKMNECWLMTQM